MTEYKKNFDVRWADLDPNNHLRHSAYNDYAAQVRVAFLQDSGLSMDVLQRHNLGPILFSESTVFMKEIRPGETVTVNLRVAGLTSDGRKWKMRHEFFKADGTKAAEINVAGAWFDTQKRAVTAPPENLRSQFATLPKTEDFIDSF